MSNRFDAGGVLRNFITRLGTERARSSHTEIGTRIYLRQRDLDTLDQHALVRRVADELPGDAGGKPTVNTSGDHNADLEQRLRDLNAAKRFRRAGYVSRAYGGAAVWVVTRGGGDPSVELDLDSVEKVENLVVINRFELTPQWAGDAEARYGLYQRDPRKHDYLEPTAYLYTPAQGGETFVIHASRLIRFYGVEVPEHLRSEYNGWGAPVIEGSYRTFGQIYMSLEGGAELAYEAGHMVYNLDNLQQILSGSRRDELSEWMSLQNESRSVLRGTILGAGQSAERMEMKATGWSDVTDRLLQIWASENGMPLTKLYGTAPGGLSTDDASAHRNWAAQVEDYQQDVLCPAYERLLTIICRGRREPTRGDLPDSIEVELPPYDVPTKTEEATIANTWADVITKTIGMGVIDTEEAREILRRVKGVALIEEEEGIAEPSHLLAMLEGDEPGAEAATAPTAAQDERPALSGAQALAMKDIIASVYAGELPPDSAIQMLSFVFDMPVSRARAIVGRDAPADFTPPTDVVASRQDDEGDRAPLDLSEKPPQDVQDAARRALDVRGDKPESLRAMTSTGIARARDLSNGRPVTIGTMRTMWSWFQRHESDKSGSTWDDQGKGWQAWHGWGGDPGRDWVTRRLKRHGHLVQEDGEWGLVPHDAPRGDTARIDPYGGPFDPDLPAPVLRMSETNQSLWVSVFNDVYEKTSGDEQEAFAAAYGTVMGPGRADDEEVGTEAAEPADPSEQLEGSAQNKRGTASGTRGGIDLADSIIEALENKVEAHNKEHTAESTQVDMGMLKAVYRRGAGAYSSSHDPDMSRNQWSMARVNAFLELVAKGKPSNPDYTTDYDLLPDGHPKAPEDE